LEPWRDLRENEDGDLMIPVRDLGKNVVDVLIVDRDGRSRFAFPKRPTPCYVGIGPATESMRVCVDFEAAARLHGETGQGTAAAFSPSAAKRVVEVLRARHAASGRTVEIYNSNVVDFPAGKQRKPALDFVTPPEPGDDGRQVIVLAGGALPEIVDHACDVLANPETRVFRRGGSIVRPTTWAPPPPTLSASGANSSSKVTRPEGAVILQSLDEAAVADVLTRHARFVKFDKRSNSFEDRDCPSQVAATLLARRGDGWSMPSIRAIVRAPTLRPDGTVLTRAGYDEPSQLLLASDVEWPDMDPSLGLAEAEAAADKLTAALSSFPFVSRSDESAMVAALITVIIRPSLRSAPLFAITAPAAGTGKSKLADLAAILATGRAAPVISGAADEVELEKRMGASLLAGDALVVLDNLSGSLKSDLLCSVLTQSQVSIRALGASQNFDVPSVATWLATGNNLIIAGDMTRRVCLIGLDAKCERPEDRRFDRDVLAHFQEHRVRLVMACLTIVRAYLASSKRINLSPMGSFEDWSDIVRCALVWVGMADPLESAKALRTEDPERERAATAFRALKGEGTFTSPSIARRAVEDSQLAEALAEFFTKQGRLDTRQFGWFLRKSRNKTIAGLTLTKVEGYDDGHWRVQ